MKSISGYKRKSFDTAWGKKKILLLPKPSIRQKSEPGDVLIIRLNPPILIVSSLFFLACPSGYFFWNFNDRILCKYLISPNQDTCLTHCNFFDQFNSRSNKWSTAKRNSSTNMRRPWETFIAQWLIWRAQAPAWTAFHYWTVGLLNTFLSSIYNSSNYYYKKKILQCIFLRFSLLEHSQGRLQRFIC
jgi:hypothetical protein